MTFEEERNDQDQTVPSFQADEERAVEEEEEEEEEEETDGKPDGPERSSPPTDQQQKTRDEIAKEKALAKYSAQLEQGQSLDHITCRNNSFRCLIFLVSLIIIITIIILFVHNQIKSN